MGITLHHPWLPRKTVLVGLPWVAVLIQLVTDTLFAVKEADAVLLTPLLMAHQPVMGLLFLIGLRRFPGINAQVADWLAENASFAIALAVEPVNHQAAVL